MQATKNFMFMKKISLLAIAFATTCTAMAQDGTQQGTGKDFKPLRTPMSKAVRFGVQAGVNMAKFNDNNYSYDLNTNTKTGFHFGAFVNIPLGGPLRFQPGILYNTYGSKLDVRPGFPASAAGTSTTAQSVEQDLQYISLPLMLQFQSRTGVFVELGPQVSFLGKTELQYENSDEDNKDAFDKLDVSAAIGAGYLSRIGIGLNLRYNFGLSNVVEDNGGNNSSNDGPELKNRVFSIGLVYHFGAAK
jgi:predicted small secreted protein